MSIYFLVSCDRLASFIGWFWQAFVLPPKTPYWIQRADFSSSDYPPARFRRGLAALRRHDWAAEGRHGQERAEAGEEISLPGIGYFHTDQSVLHICPSRFGGAQCFFLREDAILDLPYANPAQQRRLLRLFYGGRHRLLASLFQSNLVEPAWAELLHGAWKALKILAVIHTVFLLLVAGLVFATDLSAGQPARLAFAHPDQPAVRALDAGDDDRGRPAVHWLPVGGDGAHGADGPHHPDRRARPYRQLHHRRRHPAARGRARRLDRGMAQAADPYRLRRLLLGRFRLAASGHGAPAPAAGQAARKDQGALRLRNHAPDGRRSRAGARAPCHNPQARGAMAAWRTSCHTLRSHRLRGGHEFRDRADGAVLSLPYPVPRRPSSSFGDTVRFMFDMPSVLWITVGVALVFSLVALPDAIRVHGRAWSEFYGDKLEAALKAGRGVERAEHHDIPPIPDGLSARELLGLHPGYTIAQLRAAWLRLARELHPDRWSAAGPAVRKMKEAALKRVNAARDELAPMAI